MEVSNNTGAQPVMTPWKPDIVPRPDHNVYEIRIQGLLDESMSDWLGGMEIHHDRLGNTQLVGGLPDQAALYGILVQLRDLGLSLLGLRQIGTE